MFTNSAKSFIVLLFVICVTRFPALNSTATLVEFRYYEQNAIDLKTPRLSRKNASL